MSDLCNAGALPVLLSERLLMVSCVFPLFAREVTKSLLEAQRQGWPWTWSRLEQEWCHPRAIELAVMCDP
jgi:hypothetical protein